jgi:hypothetical protein
MNEPIRIGEIMQEFLTAEWRKTSLVAPLANLTGFCRANTTCPECGTTVYEGRQAYVTPYNAPPAYLHVAYHPMCGPQVRVENPASRDTRT